MRRILFFGFIEIKLDSLSKYSKMSQIIEALKKFTEIENSQLAVAES